MVDYRLAMMTNRYILRDLEGGITFLSHVEFEFHRPGNEHTHTDLQIIGILSGRSDIAVGPETRMIEAGDIAVFPAGVRHTVPATANRQHVQLLDLRIDTHHRGDLARAVNETAWPQVVRGSPHELDRIAEDLGAGATRGGTAQRAAIHRAAWSILALLAGSFVADQAPRVDRRVAIAEQYMLQNLTRPISVDDIASSCALSISQLNRLYRTSAKVSPAQRLREMRIDRARELLATSLLNVKEIAFACGFVCPNHFCRLFKQDVGLTPGNYRDRAAATVKQNVKA